MTTTAAISMSTCGGSCLSFRRVQTAVEKNANNPANGFRAKGERFAANGSFAAEGKLNGSGGIGPGEYEAHQHNTVTQHVDAKVKAMSRQNPGFGIAGPAHKLPHEQPVEDGERAARSACAARARALYRAPCANAAYPCVTMRRTWRRSLSAVSANARAHARAHMPTVRYRQHLGPRCAVVPHTDKEYPGPGKYETNLSELDRANGHSSSFKLPIDNKHKKKQELLDEEASGRSGGKGKRTASAKRGSSAGGGSSKSK